jgi:hypothetical protein
MRRPLPAVFCLVLLVVFSRTMSGQSPAPTVGCPAPEHRQFEFWVGDWNVTVQGNQAGTNVVTLEENGCLIHEHWTGAKGGTGQSFNFYDQSTKEWHQFWVDNQGGYLHLTGTYAERRLVLVGMQTAADGSATQQRLTFFNNADGSVRQLWESSADQGKTWQIAFDGLYRRR